MYFVCWIAAIIGIVLMFALDTYKPALWALWFVCIVFLVRIVFIKK